MLLSLHLSLLHAVQREAVPTVLSCVQRALCALEAATPYDRMPSELLPELVKVRWGKASG